MLQEQLCRANVLAPVILRLEDFGHDLRLESVQAIVEYIYRGEVLIESDRFMDVAEAAHTLGVNGLKVRPILGSYFYCTGRVNS